MGYTHYWYREKEIRQAKFDAILADMKKMLPEIDKAGVQLANGFGEGEPEFNNTVIRFNGAIKCGHKKDDSVVIPWPAKGAGGVANNWQEDAKAGNWFAGTTLMKRTCNGDCSYETVHFPRVVEEERTPRNNEYFNCCKTAFRPYDIALLCLLIIAKHHLKDGIRVSSDGEDGHWFDGKMLCQMVLGYGMNYHIDKEEGILAL